MSPENGTRVALYARVSTTGQADDGHSLAAQLEDMRAYAKLYRLEVVTEITDAGQSGKTLDRPGVHELQRLIAEGQISGIVIWKLDRLTRNVRDLGNLLEAFKEQGIALSSVQEKLDTSTAAGTLMVNILMSVAQWQREDAGERTKRGIAQAQRAGKRVGQPPYGWTVQDGILVKDAQQQQVIRRIRALNRKGYSLREVARTLNNESITTRNRKQWSATQVSRALAKRR